MIGNSNPLHLVLIDDDELIQAAWKITANTKGHQIACFSNVDDFQKSSVPKNIPIYIDYHISEQENGIDVASRLHQMGYERLYITTGSARESVSVPTSIKEVISKDYPDF